jgi:hypothetical protein
MRSVWAVPPDGCELALDPSTDDDGDGVGTGVFNGQPAIGGPAGLAFPSDHSAVSADVSCD